MPRPATLYTWFSTYRGLELVLCVFSSTRLCVKSSTGLSTYNSISPATTRFNNWIVGHTRLRRPHFMSACFCVLRRPLSQTSYSEGVWGTEARAEGECAGGRVGRSSPPKPWRRRAKAGGNLRL